MGRNGGAETAASGDAWSSRRAHSILIRAPSTIAAMVLRVRLVLLVAAVVVLGAACTSAPTDTITSITVGTPIPTLAVSQSTEPEPEPETTTTSQPKQNLTAPAYTIVDRVEGESNGDTVIVLLDSESYDSLTDLDLFDLIAEIVELFPPVAVVHVVDDVAAANVIGNPDASEAERQAVALNYLARLDNGFRITYLGPFASSGTAVLGS